MGGTPVCFGSRRCVLDLAGAFWISTVCFGSRRCVSDLIGVCFGSRRCVLDLVGMFRVTPVCFGSCWYIWDLAGVFCTVIKCGSSAAVARGHGGPAWQRVREEVWWWVAAWVCTVGEVRIGVFQV